VVPLLTISDKDFQQLTSYIKSHYGIKLGPEKRTLITGRLGSTLAQKGMDSFAAYYEYLMKDDSGQAVFELLNKITTNHTYFMREPEHFRFYQTHVLPWIRSTAVNKDVRVWSAGCSKGQEPYTLAMIMQDYFGTDSSSWNMKILATDISAQALETAHDGIYAVEEVALLPDRWRKTHFKKMGQDKYQVQQALKNEIILRSFNLMNEKFPFKKQFHTIFCRNVMIYFDAPTKKKLVKRFNEHLMPGGYLFIGHSESLGRDNEGLHYVQPAVYRKE